MVAFAISGLLVLLLVGVAGVFVLRRIGTAEAKREAENLATVAARGVIEPRLTDGILSGTAASRVAVDALVYPAVLHDPIVRVKIVDPATGLIVYSDQASLIGSSYAIAPDQREALRTGDVIAGLTDLSLPQNRSERGLGPLFDVSVPIHTTSGHELLFQASLRFESVAGSARRLWISFLPVLAVALLALAMLQIPFAYRLARRVKRSQQDRERLLQRAIESSDLERRRIAADLHDGSIQQLAGLSMSLAAAADALEHRDPTASRALHEAADGTRQGVRSLRSAVMGISPPDLQRAGLRAGLSDLTAPLAEEGVRAEVDVPADLTLPIDVESLLFRASREAIRNITAHAHATHVRLGITGGARCVVLEVADDGVGFTPLQEEDARANGHLGLRVLGDLARDAGGELRVDSLPGRGTVVRLEVPLP
ncbi:MAG: sensor histidine kinase [Actinomycetota bacterium]